MFIFDALLRYAQTGYGDVKALSGELAGRLRLRVGDYRIFFSPVEDGLHIHSVKHRKTLTANWLLMDRLPVPAPISIELGRCRD